MHEVTTFFNFLPYASNIYQLCKQLKFYNCEDYKKETLDECGTWPGFRTITLAECSPFLHIHLMTLLSQQLVMSKYKEIHMFCHLRLQEDEQKDWIHFDNTDTAIIYLSPTNYESGTNFYDSNENVLSSVKFIQGSCVFFKSGILHKSIGNHGDNINNGRLTMNIFMHKE